MKHFYFVNHSQLSNAHLKKEQSHWSQSLQASYHETSWIVVGVSGWGMQTIVSSIFMNSDANFKDYW